MARMISTLDLPALESLRVRRGVTKKAIAQSLGMHSGTLANWLTKARRGKPVPLALVCLLAFALSCQPNDLMADPIAIEYGTPGRATSLSGVADKDLTNGPSGSSVGPRS